MIRHCVFVTYKETVSETEKAAIAADIAALQPSVPGYLSVVGGANVSPEGLGRGYDSAFIIDFRDAAARDAYLVHPDHQKAGGRIVAAAKGGIDGVFVYDFEITD